jgi:CheY-like chemotaxis protein
MTSKTSLNALQKWFSNLAQQSDIDTALVAKIGLKLSTGLLPIAHTLQAGCQQLGASNVISEDQRQHLEKLTLTSDLLTQFITELANPAAIKNNSISKKKLPLPKVTEETPLYPHVDLSGIRTLLVDDNTIQRNKALKQLQLLGLHCTAATTDNLLQLLHSAEQNHNPFQVVVISAKHYDHHLAYLGRMIRSNTLLNHVMTTLALPNTLADFEKERAHFDGFACILELNKPERLEKNLVKSWYSWAAKINFVNKSNVLHDSRILVVEDEPIPQMAMVWQLQHLGYVVDIAVDGHTAFKLLEQHNYDLIFMDIGLPDISGLEVTTVIRKRENSLQHVPIIGLTIYARESDEKTGLQAGMNEYIVKPLTSERLREILNRWIKKTSHSKNNTPSLTAIE